MPDLNRNRIDPILKLLGHTWKRYPNLRLGQIMHHVCQNDTAIFYLEDYELASRLAKVCFIENAKKVSKNKKKLTCKKR